MNIGYACINMTLRDQDIFTSRSMIKRTFASKGPKYASQLALKNSQDLLTIVKWNEEHGIKFFRVSSGIFPWASEYKLEDLPDFAEIRLTLEEVGSYVKSVGQRLTAHPGPFNKLTSPRPDVIRNTYKDLITHGEMFDLMCLERSPYAKINIHVGASYGDKPMACRNFNKNFKGLPESVRSRLTVENDDRASLYSTKELKSVIYEEIGIPIVFDYHHHGFCTGEQTEREALETAISTWPDGITPVVHFSESRAKEKNDSSIKANAHSDYVYGPVNTYGYDVDIMVEAKMKEWAIFKWMRLHGVTE